MLWQSPLVTSEVPAARAGDCLALRPRLDEVDPSIT